MDGGFGGMLSIRLAGGAAQAHAVLHEVRVFKRAGGHAPQAASEGAGR